MMRSFSQPGFQKIFDNLEIGRTANQQTKNEAKVKKTAFISE